MRSTATSVSMRSMRSDLAPLDLSTLLVHPRNAVAHLLAVGPHANDLRTRKLRGRTRSLLRRQRLHLDQDFLVLRQIERLVGHEHFAVVSRLDRHHITSRR